MTEAVERLVALRHDLHRHPELQFQEVRTSGIVARELASLGLAVESGFAKTGVIGTLKRGTGRRVIGLRADMDALPILEETGLPYASSQSGVMHACGHDGHTTMLLGAAALLVREGRFDGTVHFIFQPAEEGGSGAKVMVDEGLFQRFPCDMIFGLHNIPGTAEGQILVRPGAITAAVDVVEVGILGLGGHGAIPHCAVDPIQAAGHVVTALQSIVSRNIDPLEPAVITIGAIHAGTRATIIPERCDMTIGVRSCTEEVRALIRQRILTLVNAQAESFGCRAEIVYNRDTAYPPGNNSQEATDLVRAAALDLGQKPEAIDLKGPFMFSEDFAFFQQIMPSCYFGLGNGDSPSLHDAAYDFNDNLLRHGPAFWKRLVEAALPCD